MKKIVLRPKCRLRIRHVKKIGKKGDEFGEFLEMKNKKFKKFYDIKISIKKNKRVSVYFRTLVHELLHFAFHLLWLAYDKKVLSSSEHDFIDGVEDTVLVEIQKLRFYKQKNKGVYLDEEKG